MALIALKVDVDTLRGTREGVPRLVEALREQGAGATFLFSLGPDHTGRALRRIFQPGFFKKVRRTSVTRHYGLKTLMYGTLLPGPDIGKLGKDILLRVRDQGFETGIHSWDHVGWQNNSARADQTWICGQLQAAQNRYSDIFKEPAKTHGAAGWQMPRLALRAAAEMGFEYCTDCRTLASASVAHFPVFEGEIINCPQLPTDLPTFDELIGIDGCTEDNVDARLLSRTQADSPVTPDGPAHADHVFTLHAELEGMKLLPVFKRLIEGWKRQGHHLVSTREVFRQHARLALPYHAAFSGTVPGRSGQLLMSGGPSPGHAGP